ncbi:3-methyl-2-oxobutanoate hydroxymethyltransferase [Ectothiorhodospira lacustris]|uniref:3-methyl-2-oxobutanoate hydroxymethyltransferase n=1 Tax=Ectothiorhodospira lacustris TaxID=2899127 RepID=UPI001EE8BF1C|nr:3-methyl-2-oxobutanoate hydroxymethyltransferase [Ectothiorhodospira lacustris]MCG5523048.1 3-methyl-2-oxobutanoate hydroxymethyltransferase [Ectothiorhodospira lacustris]
MSVHSQTKRLTLRDLQGLCERQEPIASLTAYDATQARLMDEAGVDLVLVGDSLGMVVLGHETTVPVTVDDVIYHTRAVARGLRRALLMADMPFMSYGSVDQALHNAARLMQEGGAQMVKLEGDAQQVAVVTAMSHHGIPVCAHLGLRPQSVHKLGGYRVQGREAAAAQRMIKDAMALQEAGADMLLLECVPSTLAAEIRAMARIPVIGIGAGIQCDGQILVVQDILGMTAHAPRFARNFLTGRPGVQAALAAYVQAVKSGAFPAAEHTFLS